MWGGLIHPHLTDEKTRTQKNLYPAQGHIAVKVSAPSSNLSLPDSQACGPFAATQPRFNPWGRMGTSMPPCYNVSHKSQASALCKTLRRALPYFKHGTLGFINYCEKGNQDLGWSGWKLWQLGVVQVVGHPGRRMHCQDAKHERN